MPDTGDQLRSTHESDDGELARLLATAYDGTIDFDADADYAQELRTWRSFDGADDAASRIAVRKGRVVGACLVGSELGHPFLYEIAVLPGNRQRGLALAMLTSALNHLASAGHEACSAWVTYGNLASERLLESRIRLRHGTGRSTARRRAVPGGLRRRAARHPRIGIGWGHERG